MKRKGRGMRLGRPRPHAWQVNGPASAPNSAACWLRRCGTTARTTIIRAALSAQGHARWLRTAATTPHADFPPAALPTRPAAATRVHAAPCARGSPDAEAYFVGVPAALLAPRTPPRARRSRLGWVRRPEQPSSTQQGRTGQLKGPPP